MDLKTTTKTVVVLVLLIISTIVLYELTTLNPRENQLAYSTDDFESSKQLYKAENNVLMSESLVVMPIAAILLYLIVKRTNSI